MITKKVFYVACSLLIGLLFCIPDATAQRFTLDAQAESFYAEKVRQLDSVRVMSHSDKACLREFFTGHLYANGHLKWSFQLAMNHVTYYPPYYFALFKDDVIHRFNVLNDEDIRELRIDYHQNDSCILHLYPFIKRKNIALALIEKMYVLNDSLLEQRKGEFLSNYAARKRRFLLSHSQLSKNYDLALKSFKALGLSSGQIDSIFDKGRELRGYLSRNANYDYWKHERTHLRSILTNDQYDYFLTLKHLSKAHQSAEHCWSQLKAFGAASDLDSLVVIRQVTEYHVERSKLFDLYAYENREQYNQLAAELYRSFCPPAMRRVNELTNNKNKQKTYQGSYAW